MTTTHGAQPESASPPQRSSDQSLLRLVRTGEGEAATRLYERYAERLRELAGNQIGRKLSAKLEPDDVVQSVFRTFFRRVVDGQYEVPDGKEIWGLILVIALHKVRAAAVYHAASKRDIHRTHTLFAEHANLAAPDEGLLLKTLVAELASQLSETQQQIITMRVEGFSADEIAKSVGRSKRTVERVLQQFRTKLMAEIEKD